MTPDPDNMTGDFPLEIELSDIDGATVEGERPAVQSFLGRGVDTASAQLYLQAEAGRELMRHAMSVTDREVGGILVGTVHRDRGEFVLATGAIPAKYSQESRANLTFTHASWQYMLAEQERRFPGTVVVGWYHTHPGYGLFLSGQDLYIHRSFFTLPHQVAVVVDPIAGTLALFRSVHGQIVKEPGVPVYGGQAETLVVLPPPPPPSDTLIVHPAEIPSVEEGLDDGVRMIEEMVDKAFTSFDQLVERRLHERVFGEHPSRGGRIDRKV
ncbi:MAG: Mov34/MPN/PAD-1 family protein [Armatimonadota bacterium]